MVNAHLFFYCNSFKKNLDVEEIALILTLAQDIESRTFFVFQLQLISHCRFLSQFYSLLLSFFIHRQNKLSYRQRHILLMIKPYVSTNRRCLLVCHVETSLCKFLSSFHTVSLSTLLK